MKKCLIMLLAAALFVVAGCKKDDNNAKKMTFTSDFGGGAKTEINDHSMKWTTDDDIIVNGETFVCEVKEEGARAEFTGKVVQSPYNAYYPTSIWNEGTLTLPATQYYDENNLSRVSPMYACSENTELTFHNICALVKLNLKGTGTVKTITASADQSLSGEFTIAGNETDGYYANVPQLRDGAATVTLDCGQGEALDATTPKAFYIALPQGEYTNLKFTVSNGTITKEVTMDENDLVAGTLYVVEKEVELDAPVIPTNVLPGLFTIDDEGHQVYFSTGNLCYIDDNIDDNIPGTFQFEEQWSTECYTLDDNDNVTWNKKHISRFFYSDNWELAIGDDLTLTTSISLFTNNGKTKEPNPDFTVQGETGKFRSLEKTEWETLLYRKNSAGQKLQGMTTLTLEDETTVVGMVFLPDNSSVLPGSIKTPAAVIANNAVFIPSGRRVNPVHTNYTHDIGKHAYCAAAYYVNKNGYYAVSDATPPLSNWNKWQGFPIRLVKDAN